MGLADDLGVEGAWLRAILRHEGGVSEECAECVGLHPEVLGEEVHELGVLAYGGRGELQWAVLPFLEEGDELLHRRGAEDGVATWAQRIARLAKPLNCRKAVKDTGEAQPELLLHLLT